MEKLTRENLHKIQSDLDSEIKIRETGSKKAYITVNMGDCGIEHGAKDVFYALCKAVDDASLRGQVIVTQTAIEGLCDAGPMVEVLVAGTKVVKYSHVTAADAQKIIKEHIINGKVVESLLLKL